MRPLGVVARSHGSGGADSREGRDMPKEIVVLGAGFAGLEAVSRLRRLSDSGRARVRLVDRRREAVFSPLLPDLISERVEPSHISYPIEPHARAAGAEFVHGNVRRIDLDRRRVEMFEGGLSYDYLIIATGCDTNYFGSDEVKRHAIGLKWIEEGAAIRHRACSMLGAGVAECVEEGRRRKPPAAPAHFVIVGGGYTGFEAAGHLAHLVRCQTGVPFERMREEAEIVIVEVADRPLCNVSDSIRRWSVDLIAGFGVEVRTKTTVTGFDGGSAAALSDGTRIDSPLILWTAGVKPGPAVESTGLPTVEGRRLEVDECLRVPGHEEVFAAGDVAGALGEDGKPLRMAVQFSISAGAAAGENVSRALEGRPLQAYAPFDLGYIVPLAPGKGAGVVLGQELRGTIPYALHYFMSFYRSWGWDNRRGVLGDLIRRGSR